MFFFIYFLYAFITCFQGELLRVRHQSYEWEAFCTVVHGNKPYVNLQSGFILHLLSLLRVFFPPTTTFRFKSEMHVVLSCCFKYSGRQPAKTGFSVIRSFVRLSLPKLSEFACVSVVCPWHDFDVPVVADLCTCAVSSEVENGIERRHRRTARSPAGLQLCLDTESEASESRKRDTSMRYRVAADCFVNSVSLPEIGKRQINICILQLSVHNMFTDWLCFLQTGLNW